jgi:hypothetical protein
MEECARSSARFSWQRFNLRETGRGKRRGDKGRSTVSLLWNVEKEMESETQSRVVKDKVIRAERG